MAIVPHITTDRVLLREARRSDFDAFASIVMDPERPNPPGPVDRQTAWRIFNAGLGAWVMDGIGFWAMEERETGTFIGSIGAFHREPRPVASDVDAADLELGWSLVRRCRGRGLATEAGQAVVAHVFETRKAPRVIAHIDHDNPSSIRVAEKLGMRYEREVVFYESSRLRRYVLKAK
jgi:RimJ/RimL family protein N-acetyltransferase